MDPVWSDSQCYRVARPILIMLLFNGIDIIFVFKGFGQAGWLSVLRKMLRMLHMVLLITYIFLVVFIIVLLVLYPQPLPVITFYANSVIFLTQGIFLNATLTFRQKTVDHFTICLIKVCNEVMGKEFSPYRQPSRFIRGSLLWLALAVIIGKVSQNHNSDPLNPDMILKSAHLDLKYGRLLEGILEVIFPTITFNLIFTHIFVVLLYLTFCLLLSCNYSRLINCQSKSSGTAPSNCPQFREMQVLMFIKHHQNICTVVCLFDQSFKALVATWSFSELICLTFNLRSLNLGKCWIIDREVCMICVMYIGTFILKLLFAAKLNRQVVHSLTFLTKVDENAMKDSLLSNEHTIHLCEYEIKAQLYIQYISLDPPSLSGWGLYIITNGCILMAAANVLTYVLVLYNIQDDDSASHTCYYTQNS